MNAHVPPAVPPAGAETTQVVIVGSGFSGLIMALRLKRRRIPFLILEKADGIGGTWRDNTYPGCACDIPSHLYSIASEPKSDWKRAFASQPDILAYLKRVVARRGLAPHLRFGAALTEARWDERAARWTLRTADGRRFAAPVMVLAVGALHLPLIPRIPGLETFRGESFHSARWNHRFDFKNKRVAVIGTGASAIQFVPQIAPLVAKLSLYQRTPPWVVPKGDREISDRTRTLLGLFPGLRLLRRGAIFAVQELRHLAMRRNPKVAGLARMMASKHRARAIPDLELQERLTPTYEIGCKRILRSDDYYPALARPNVEIVDGGIDRITETGIVGADGVERPADAILFGTGFHVTDGYDALTVIGRDGLALRDAWAERGMSAAFGTAVAGFPNMFMLLGPNTGLGHNSVVLMVEAQVGYVMRRLSQMRIRRLRSIEIAPEVQRAYADEMQTRLASTVWQAGGCMSWYQDAQGRNTTLWPGTVIEYRRRKKRATLRDYTIEKATETV